MSNSTTWQSVRETLSRILASRAVWVALVILIEKVIFQVWPNFNKELWDSMTSLLFVVLAAAGIGVATYRTVQSYKAARNALR